MQGDEAQLPKLQMEPHPAAVERRGRVAVKTTAPTLLSPYGGELIDRVVPVDEFEELKARAGELISIQISERSVCDLELLATGAFSPLARFMGAEDYQSALATQRLTSGAIFPIPITLPVEPSRQWGLDQQVALRNARNELLAVLRIEEIYHWDLPQAAQMVCGTQDPRHPLVAEMHHWGKVHLTGEILLIQPPSRYDFQELRLTPCQTRTRLEALGRRNVVAFQTRNPLHRAHEELTRRAVESLDGVLLLHPAVGMTKPGDVDHYTRVRTYRALADYYYNPNRIVLALLPLAMRLVGPREALWHALIRRNYGANHLIVGRDHASPGLNSKGCPFYDPYQAQEVVKEHAAELGVQAVPFRELVYLPDEDRYEERSKVPAGTTIAVISGTEARRQYLDRGRPLPAWFTRPEVAKILATDYPARHHQGVCVWFTGLSGSGKSTTATVLTTFMLERGRQVTVLDGDVVRTHLSKGLAFSKEDRDINIRRIGFVAAELVRHGAMVICAAVSPYRATRADVRNLAGKDHFVEVFVDTPLSICEQRDPKGMYAKARRGEIKVFTGIDDPYEKPEHPEITLDTVEMTPEQNARRILSYLQDQGFLRRRDSSPPADATNYRQ